MKTLVAQALMLGVALPVLAQEPNQPDDSRIANGKELFATYVQQERTFDPDMANLYSDDALIRNQRKYPSGQVRQLTIPARQYKKLLRKSIQSPSRAAISALTLRSPMH